MSISKFLLFGFLVLLATSSFAKDRVDLTIVNGTVKRVITGDDFRQLHYDSIVVNDPVYNKHKRYAGYWLADILRLADIPLDPTTTWTFTALDGYKASIDVQDAIKSGAKAFVAVRDLDAADNWEKIKQGKEWITPGPYYVVWQTPLVDVTPSIKLPWPYEMVEISIHNSNEDTDKIFPESADKSESVKKGFKIFQQNCMACHSINLQGGVLGPELNVPKNILEYRDRKYLKEFIGDPSSFRARSKMPSFNTILAGDSMEDLLNYLDWISKHKVSL